MGPPTQPQPRTELHEICELIKLDPGTLEQALCSRTVKARDETVLTALSVSQVSGTSPPAPSPPRCGLTPREPPWGSVASPAPLAPGLLLPGRAGQEHLQPPLRLAGEPHQHQHPGERWALPPPRPPPLPSWGWDVAQHPAISQVKPGKQRKVMGVLDIYGFEIFQVSGRTHLGPSCCWGERGAGLGAPARTCHSGPFSCRTMALSSSSSTTAMRSCSRSSS